MRDTGIRALIQVKRGSDGVCVDVNGRTSEASDDSPEEDRQTTLGARRDR
jgi:hypothetical protein